MLSGRIVAEHLLRTSDLSGALGKVVHLPASKPREKIAL